MAHLDDPLAEYALEVLGGLGPLLELRDGVHSLTARHAHLDGTQLLQVAGHRRLGGDHALDGEKVDDLGLAGDRVVLQQPGDPVLALRLSQSHWFAPSSQYKRPRWACRRFSACSQTRLWGPSSTDAATSSPRW